MPTLDWIGKKAVVGHHREVPYRLLRCDRSLSVGDPGTGNLLVQGDNLLALKALLPHYAGQVKCIYIDPPYNTGNENWVYNDAVNSPEMRSWLGRVVGGEAEDLSRHDKWLCMIYPRMALLRQFLREDGAIFISIDDNELQALRYIMDEIFGSANFVASIIWQKRTSPDARLNLGPAHDYVVCYARNKLALKGTLHKVRLSEDRSSAYKNPDKDHRGAWASVDLTGQTGHATPDQFFTIVTPTGKKIPPPPGRCWALAEATFKQLVADNRIWFGKTGGSRPRRKYFLSESEGVMPWTWWPHTEVGHNEAATKELAEILGKSDAFNNPKPSRLIQRILAIATDKDSLILDSFAGSGTTGHAVAALNREDGGNRRFILVEMDEAICRNVTRERLARVCAGYTDRKGNPVEGLGGGFRFCTLGAPVLAAGGDINPEVRFADLAAFVYFHATGEPLPKAAGKASPLLGVHRGAAVYLLYNGILKDKSPGGGNVLTRETLAFLPDHDGPKIVFGTGCRLGPARLARERVEFRQIPFAIKDA